MNPLFLRQFKLVSLFIYRVQHLKKTKKLSFQLTIPLSFEVSTTQLDFIVKSIALKLDFLIVGLLLHFLCMIEVLLANNHQFLKLKKKFFRNSWFWTGIKIFFIKNAKMISIIKLERYVINTDILGIIINKLCHKKKLCSIILFKVNKGWKIGFYYVVLLFNITICLRLESD